MGRRVGAAPRGPLHIVDSLSPIQNVMKQHEEHSTTSPGLEIDIIITQLEQGIQELREGVHRVRNVLHGIYGADARDPLDERQQSKPCPEQGIPEDCPSLEHKRR